MTHPPANRYVFERNPYYHRVDQNGVQLPYVDQVVINIAESSIIPAKTGSGEADLQERYLSFADYTFLKEGEKRNNYTVRLWTVGKGSAVALFPEPEHERYRLAHAFPRCPLPPGALAGH